LHRRPKAIFPFPAGATTGDRALVLPEPAATLATPMPDMPDSTPPAVGASAFDSAAARSATQSRRAERLVAVFEAAKGLLVLMVGFGLLSVVHQDLEQIAEELVRHFHLNPASRYPRIFLDVASHFSNLRMWLLAALAFGYASLRLAEAYGLWRGRRWAEWLALASGTLYVPIEVYELFTGLSWIKIATLTANIAIVACMSRVLWRSRQRSPHAAPSP
jgi:uncharacterized membrane protein (DUF2068 family)